MVHEIPWKKNPSIENRGHFPAIKKLFDSETEIKGNDIQLVRRKGNEGKEKQWTMKSFEALNLGT